MPSLLPPHITQALHQTTLRGPKVGNVVRQLFYDEAAYGAALFVGALQVMDIEELQSFDAKTIRLELQDRLNCKTLPESNLAQLMAIVAATTTDLFYTSLPAFIDLCNILAGNPAPPGLFDPADPFEMSWAVAEVDLVDPRDSREIEFSEEIRAYMGMMLAETGFFSPPAILGMAIMPNIPSPSEITSDAELLPADVASNTERHDEILAMLIENTRQLVSQIEPVIGKIEV